MSEQTGPVVASSAADHRVLDIPEPIPLLFLVSQIVFPFGASQIHVRTAANLALLDALPDKDALFAVAFAPGMEPDAVKAADLGRVGVLARVIARLKLPDGSEQVTLQGLQRLFLESVEREKAYFTAHAAQVVERGGDTVAAATSIERIVRMAGELAGLDAGVQPEHVEVLRMNMSDPGRFADLVAAMADVDLPHQKRILEQIDVPSRLEYVATIIREQLEYARIEHETDSTVRAEIESTQREYYLRRQMKVLREALGEKSREEEAAREALEKLEALDTPPDVEQAARAEIERLRGTNPASAEFGVIQNYLDWLLGLPWGVTCPETFDISAVSDQLNEDHYGLEQPKERILEYLAVRRLAPDAPAPVLCFLGPPGTGKTSLAQSIAHAMGRPLARLSVGGVRDESAIRGHRRTYVGAMPGRIVQALKRAKCANPVMVIDEVDKMGSGPEGDPSSALLEVLDPEQNSHFVDHFLDVAVDLSGVLFITTANYWYAVPEPLRDRMEVIELSSYVEQEKIEIAKRHLVPRIRERTGLPVPVRIDLAAIKLLIRGYTAEAGVRQLYRALQSIYRKLALRHATRRKVPRRVTAKLVRDLLGPPPASSARRRRRAEVGVVTGLAWTSVGGDVLLIEGVIVPGEGGLQLTGSLGDVMRESVAAALTYVRSRATMLGIPYEAFGKVDIHLHFPEGATPKDGPSAGIGVATTLTSLFTQRAVRADIAMTGEINLRGEVLPIGGLREKLAAAARLGIKHVIIPEQNVSSLHWVRPEVLDRLEIHPVKHMDEVLELALAARPRRRKAPTPK